MKTLDIVLVGVGGQGTLLASRVLGALAAELKSDVKVSEVHGMAQRGGSVVTYVRIGESVASPLVDVACADYVLAFEQMEALRALPSLKKTGVMITNIQIISPMPVVMGNAVYPEDVLETLNGTCKLIALDAFALACEAGEARAVNLVLLGVLARRMEAAPEAWHRAIEACVPARLLSANLRAFDAGYAFEEAK